VVADQRSELEPDVLRTLDWAQKTRGLRGRVKAKWREVNLRDSHKAAMARYWASKGAEQEIQTSLLAWENGFIDQSGAATEAGYDGENLAEILDKPVGKAGGSAAQEQQASMPPAEQVAEFMQSAMWRTYP
jgi:hypothetical protein